MVYAPGQTRGIARNIWGPYAAVFPNGFESNGRKGLVLIPRILQVCFWSHKVCLPPSLFEDRIQGTQALYIRSGLVTWGWLVWEGFCCQSCWVPVSWLLEQDDKPIYLLTGQHSKVSEAQMLHKEMDRFGSLSSFLPSLVTAPGPNSPICRPVRFLTENVFNFFSCVLTHPGLCLGVLLLRKVIWGGGMPVLCGHSMHSVRSKMPRAVWICKWSVQKGVLMESQICLQL